MLTVVISLFLVSTLLSVPPTFAAPSIRSVFNFPNNTFTENIAVRSNGDILLTTETSPSLYTLNPRQTSPNATIIHTFPNSTGLSGITETSSDTFAIVSGTLDLATTRGVLGSLNIWTIDLSCSSRKVRHVVTVKESMLLNGITHIPNSGIVLACDSVAGAVYGIDVQTGSYNVVVQDQLLMPVNSSTAGNVGINGCKYRSGYLYFTNSAQGLFARVKILGPAKSGDIEILAQAGEGVVYDDFAFDKEGNAWIAAHPDFVVEVLRNGTQMMARDEELLLTPTAAAFGRGKEEGVLYVTNGGKFVDNGSGGVGLIDSGIVALDMQ